MGVYDSSQGAYRKPGKFFMKGCSDILGVLPSGKLIAVEVKSEAGKASKDQVVFLEKINRMNGIGLIARSVDDVKRRLDYEGFCP